MCHRCPHMIKAAQALPHIKFHINKISYIKHSGGGEPGDEAMCNPHPQTSDSEKITVIPELGGQLFRINFRPQQEIEANLGGEWTIHSGAPSLLESYNYMLCMLVAEIPVFA